MSEPGSPICTPDWLALRGPADAAARSSALVDLLRSRRHDGPWVVRDLGCGTGSQMRWLAPRLPTPQTWYLHERDTTLLALAVADPPDGVTAVAVPGDLTAVGAADLAGTTLLTASALLDLLTAAEVDALAAACAEAGSAALLTLSVAGRVRFDPPHPHDTELAAAFDAHQRRPVDGRRLLGPDAPAVAAAAFEAHGMTVHQRPSPWTLGPSDAALVEEWLRGWLDAAVVQRPELDVAAVEHLVARRDQLATGRLRVDVGHVDVLAVPTC